MSAYVGISTQDGLYYECIIRSAFPNVQSGSKLYLPLYLSQSVPSLCYSPSPWLKVYKVLRAPCGAMELQLLHQEEVLGMGAIRYSTSTVSHALSCEMPCTYCAFSANCGSGLQE